MYRDHMAYAHVLWYDNFSKIYRIHSPNTIKGVYHSCLWTGVALHKYNGPVLDMRCQIDDQGSTISVMPPDLFIEQDIVVNSIKYIMQQGFNYYDNSYCKKYNVNNIPLKAIIDDPEHIRRTANTGTMNQVFPVRMIKHNIGSNKGLSLIMRELYEDLDMATSEGSINYTCLNLDENIFWRVLKV